jgi:hypothetical protein
MVSSAVFVIAPSVAVIVTVVVAGTARVTIVNGADTLLPDATGTDAGGNATAGLLLDNVTTAPPAGAAFSSVTVF